jgi:hypothetical protein
MRTDTVSSTPEKMPPLLVVAIIGMLLSALMFGLGYLSGLKRTPAPIVIEKCANTTDRSF